MKERPLLMSAPMVRALLAGAKSQTRRIITPQPEHLQRHEWKGKVLYDAEHRIWWWKQHSFENLIDFEDGRRELAKLCPYGIVGDRLWCKETHQVVQLPNERICVYRATCDDDSFLYADPIEGSIESIKVHKWKPSIFMRRLESRIELDITDVRVEPLQDITAADAVAEGVVDDAHGWDGNPFYPLARYRTLWQDINGRASWDTNPWVWVISFSRVDAARSAA